MPKLSKIKVNENLIEYNGFNESSHAVIKLSVSKSDVQLPMLNISFINLLLLDASYNGLEKIDDVGHETFPSVRLFNLSFNAISSVKSYVFSHLKEVEIIDFSHNCFQIFHYDRVFLKHENLKKLFLNDNLLHSIQSTFREPKVMSLNFLDFSNNFVSEFSNYDVQIHHLNMNNNSLKTVIIFDAENMILNAQNNQLEHFFAPRGNFLSLNLSNNSIEYLSNVEIEVATILDLSNNLIHLWAPETSNEYDELENGTKDIEIEQSFDKTAIKLAFQERVGIRTEFLNLENNFIESFTELKHFKNCKEFNFENNHFENLYPHQFVFQFPMLKRVNLVNNPLTKHDIKILEDFKNSSSGHQIDFIYKSLTQKPLTLSPLLPSFPLLKINLPTLQPRFYSTSIKTKIIIDQTDSTTSAPPMTSWAPQAESTTQMKSVIMTTEARRTESDENIPTKIVNERSSVWMFAILFATIIASSIIVMVYINKLRKSRNIYRGFNNEVENFL